MLYKFKERTIFLDFVLGLDWCDFQMNIIFKVQVSNYNVSG